MRGRIDEAVTEYSTLQKIKTNSGNHTKNGSKKNKKRES